MPILVTGRLSRPSPRPVCCRQGSAGRYSRNRGFTLFEVIVVVVIVGLVLTMASLAIPDDHAERQLQTETDRLLSLLNLARDEAVISSRVIGYFQQRQSYDFRYYRNKEWHKATTEHVLRERMLPDELQLSLPGTTAATDGDDDSGPTPDIVFYPSGQVSNFQISLTHAQDPLLVSELHSSAGGEIRRAQP